MNTRIIHISDTIDFNLQKSTITLLHDLNLEDSEKPIHVFINCLGGSLDMSLVLFDLFRASRAPVYTYNMGMAYSAGFVVFLGGVKRFTTVNASFMLHPPQVATEDWTTPDDLETRGRFGVTKNNCFINILVKESTISLEEAKKLTERESFFDVAQAVKYGIIYKIITKFPTDAMYEKEEE